MNLHKTFVLLLIFTLVCSESIQELEDSFVSFDLDDIDTDYLQSASTVKLVILKEGKRYVVKDNEDGAYSAENDEEVCASVEYQKTLNQTGWDLLFLNTNESFSSEVQMQCAGFLEGLATKQSISDFLFNISSMRRSTNEQYKAYFTSVYNNLLARASNPPNKSEDYWKTARLYLIQLIALKNGYNAFVSNKNDLMELWKISLPNIDGQADEIDTIIQAKRYQDNEQQTHLFHQQGRLRKQIVHKSRRAQMLEWEKAAKKSRCSVLFKLLTEEREEDGKNVLKDVIATHSTWEPFSSMNRVFKFYRLPTLDNDHNWIQMSSYPGAISSTDDYIVKEGKFLITETSISSMKSDLIKQFNAEDVDIPDFMRIQTSISLANSALEWAKIMSFQSKVKMYSSEWMALNFQNLEYGEEIPKYSFIVFSSSYEEQIIEDKTEDLIEKTFFASFNNPHNEHIRSYLGYDDLDNEYFSLEKDPRGLIFEFFQGKTTSVDKVQWLMLHNSYKQNTNNNGEPTFDNPTAALGSRSDLSESPSKYGAVDVKVANLETLQNFQVKAISGPSHQEQPVFVWSGDERHQGQPETWNFNWIDISLDNQQ